MRQCQRIMWTLLVVLGLFAAVRSAAAEEPKPAEGKIKVLVLDGGHGPFPRRLLDRDSQLACTFQTEKVGGEAYADISRWPYDVILLYNYMKNPPPPQRENFLKLADRGVGLVIVHHAIYGYRPWPEFMKIVGVTSWLSGAKDDVDFTVHVEDRQHPITRGLADFAINDETYKGHAVDPKVHLLLSTDEPGNAKSVAWVHTYRKSPVCYIQLGHGKRAYDCPQYQVLLRRAVRWAAGRPTDDVPAPTK